MNPPIESQVIRWRLRGRELTFPRPVLIMGIVNVTPDSFSDGGLYLDPKRAVAHAHELVSEGAELVDIGGESTRPNSVPVSEEEELRRVLPVIEGLAGNLRVPISIDTRKPGVARAALAAGAALVNDIGANREGGNMWEVVAEAGAGYVCMHMRGTPPTMQASPQYQDVVGEVSDFFQHRLKALHAAGVEPEQVALDVGIGFGKALDHNLKLLRELEWFKSVRRPLALGVSRKSFIGKLLGAELDARLPGSLACACWAVRAGVQIIRAHDVSATWQAVRMTEALMSQPS